MANYEEEEDEALRLAIENSLSSYAEDQQWDEVQQFVLEESAKASRELRFVVIGETGSGKSETSNSILLNRDMFSTSMKATSETKTCKVQEAEVLDRTISVVDTPGLFDADMDEKSLLREITRCIMMTAPGPHAILLVIRSGRLSKQVQETVRVFREVFGEGCTNYMIVLFTGKNALSEGRNSCTVEEYLSTVRLDVAEILKDCKNRCVVFENSVEPDSKENLQQVEELVSVVDKMLESNGGGCYTNDMFKEVECKMRDREDELRKQYEEEKQADIRNLTKMYEDELKEMEVGMTQVMYDLMTQRREQDLRDLEERYGRKDARRDARKEAESSSLWEKFLGAVPTLLNLVMAGVQMYGSFTNNTLVRDAPRHMHTVLNLIPKDKMGKGNKK